jgi:ADP-L-glycero-D-manno-heptose 6-epimerase
MLDNNFTYSKELLHWALDHRIPFVYASSASVYGSARQCAETPECEGPLNVYAYSKWLFDQYVRRQIPRAASTVVGLRYFNVYGPNEGHKGPMASMVWRVYYQLRDDGVARLFRGTDGFADGQQQRDFVSVEDVAEVNLFFASGASRHGIFNVGTGTSRSFNDIARILIGRLGRGEIQYIPFPDSLIGKYQSLTCADITRLRSAGYDRPFATLEEGIARFCERVGAVDHVQPTPGPRRRSAGD